MKTDSNPGSDNHFFMLLTELLLFIGKINIPELMTRNNIIMTTNITRITTVAWQTFIISIWRNRDFKSIILHKRWLSYQQ